MCLLGSAATRAAPDAVSVVRQGGFFVFLMNHDALSQGRVATHKVWPWWEVSQRTHGAFHLGCGRKSVLGDVWFLALTLKLLKPRGGTHLTVLSITLRL